MLRDNGTHFPPVSSPRGRPVRPWSWAAELTTQLGKVACNALCRVASAAVFLDALEGEAREERSTCALGIQHTQPETSGQLDGITTRKQYQDGRPPTSTPIGSQMKHYPDWCSGVEPNRGVPAHVLSKVYC